MSRGAARVRKASLRVTLGITALVASSLAGCGREESGGSGYNEVGADYAQVCRANDGRRVDDRECERSSSGSRWYYVPISGGRNVPPVGSSVSEGTSTQPKGSSSTRVSSRGGSYAKSGTVSRGGFGGGKGGGSKGG